MTVVFISKENGQVVDTWFESFKKEEHLQYRLKDTGTQYERTNIQGVVVIVFYRDYKMKGVK